MKILDPKSLYSWKMMQLYTHVPSHIISFIIPKCIILQRWSLNIRQSKMTDYIEEMNNTKHSLQSCWGLIGKGKVSFFPLWNMWYYFWPWEETSLNNCNPLKSQKYLKRWSLPLIYGTQYTILVCFNTAIIAKQKQLWLG